jgi:ABC-type transport system substrate-binding protein
MFSYGGSGDGARYLSDQRVRQAMSMAFDRDAMVDTFNNVEQFERAGLVVDKKLHSAIHAAEPEWLDPRGKDMGAGAKFYSFDIAEAKKLMSAAGYANGFDMTSNTIINAYPPLFFKRMEVILQMLAEIGVRARRKERDYNSDYLPNIFYAKGDFDGFGMAMGTAFSNASDFLYGWYHPDSARGTMKRGLYPQIEQDIVTARRELDNRKRTALVQDLQRTIAAQQPMLGLFEAGATVTFDLKWPEAENVGVFTGVSLPQEVYPFYWINEAKKKA